MLRSGIERLSPKAQKIIELTGEGPSKPIANVDIAAIIRDHPELIDGLNEYTQWRADEFTMIAREEVAKPVAHGISQALKDLRKPG